MLGAMQPDFNKDSARGREALGYFFTYAQGKNAFLMIAGLDGFVSYVTGSYNNAHFVENLGYAINALMTSGGLNDSELKQALELAADEINGNWDKFASQSIMQKLIDASKGFKVRYLWQGASDAGISIATNVYDTAGAVATGVQQAVVTSAGLLKYVPYLALGLAGVVGYVYLTAFKPRRAGNPRYARFDLDELIPEHKRLIKRLRAGSRKTRAREAKHQARELKGYQAIRRK